MISGKFEEKCEGKKIKKEDGGKEKIDHFWYFPSTKCNFKIFSFSLDFIFGLLTFSNKLDIILTNLRAHLFSFIMNDWINLARKYNDTRTINFFRGWVWLSLKNNPNNILCREDQSHYRLTPIRNEK